MTMTTESADQPVSKGGEYLMASAGLLLGAVLFGRFLRPFLTFAAGMTAARALWGVEAQGSVGERTREAPEWISDHKPGPSGRLTQNQKADLAMEDSFPASDPPSSY